jgi:hypothetical protein
VTGSHISRRGHDRELKTVGGPANKLNRLLDCAYCIWSETRTKPISAPTARRGADQMVFSDLGRIDAVVAREFSWNRKATFHDNDGGRRRGMDADPNSETGARA